MLQSGVTIPIDMVTPSCDVANIWMDPFPNETYYYHPHSYVLSKKR